MSLRVLLPCTVALSATLLAFAQAPVDLPSSKQLLSGAPGSPARINSLPMSMALSPDGRYAVTVNAGYGTFESKYQQSISVVNVATGKVTDFPDARTGLSNHQTLYQGIAFSRDGAHIYASLASLTSPEGKASPKAAIEDTGNAIAVYTFVNGTVTPERLIPIPLQTLAAGKAQTQLKGPLPAGKANPYPSGLCVIAGPDGHDRVLVADNLSDDVVLIDAVTGSTLQRFDLSTERIVPAAFPIAVTATGDGKRAFVALWNSSAVVALDLIRGSAGKSVALLKPSSPTAPGSHPAALQLSPDEKTLYVALANRDMVAAVDAASLQVLGYFDTKLPGQSYFGAVPDALAISPDGSRLYAANASSDAVAVFNTVFPARKYVARSKPRIAAPLGFSPRSGTPPPLASAAANCWSPLPRGRVRDRTIIRSPSSRVHPKPAGKVKRPTSERCSTALSPPSTAQRQSATLRDPPRRSPRAIASRRARRAFPSLPAITPSNT